MASYRQVIRNLTAYSRQVLSVASTQLPRRTHTLLRQNIPCVHRLVSSSFTTSTPKLGEAGVVFNVQDEDDFEERVLKSGLPVVVDFHAEWCGPCRILGPRLEKFVDAKEGSVLLAKVDIDDMQDLAVKHGVNAVPTVIGVKDGKVVNSFVGNVDDDVMEDFIKKLAGH